MNNFLYQDPDPQPLIVDNLGYNDFNPFVHHQMAGMQQEPQPIIPPINPQTAQAMVSQAISSLRIKIYSDLNLVIAYLVLGFLLLYFSSSLFYEAGRYITKKRGAKYHFAYLALMIILLSLMISFIIKKKGPPPIEMSLA
jgi:hypothetical protein